MGGADPLIRLIRGAWDLHCGKSASGELAMFATYYNEVRTHLSLDKDAPDFRRAQKFGRIGAMPILGGLHHQYVRV